MMTSGFRRGIRFVPDAAGTAQAGRIRLHRDSRAGGYCAAGGDALVERIGRTARHPHHPKSDRLLGQTGIK